MSITNKNNSSNNEICLLKRINMLPEILVDIIKEYIQNKVLLFLNKYYYDKFHPIVYNYIKFQSEIYIRTVVRQDLDYILNYIFFENVLKWNNMRNYYYKDTVYLNYVYFLYDYSIEYESNKCTKLLYRLYIQNGLKKNQHKKKTARYIKWKI